jgi:cell division protein FtsB
MKSYFPSVALLLVFCYLGVQALTGDRGLLGGHDRGVLLAQREHQLSDLTERRADLEVRVRYLRTEHLSRDLLEERARIVLGFADPRDYVIQITNASGPIGNGQGSSTRS